MCFARQHIRIQNPYFLPDSEAIDALCAAAKRGVDMRVMMPSAEASDMPMVQHAAHRNSTNCSPAACASSSTRSACCTKCRSTTTPRRNWKPGPLLHYLEVQR
ncbi:phospholipase D-like domain-containing protein [Variovorax sp. J22P240]|uniref:phospholipase D-like domain-containing protein n=1 Tax=Variovorax sp. J22P240 TaxID=3053514 RepID=UPI003365504D